MQAAVNRQQVVLRLHPGIVDRTGEWKIKEMDYLTIANARYEVMSKGHRAVADFIKNNMNDAAFMTAAKIAAASGVSEATVVRYATSLGYEGFGKLSEALSEVVRGRLTAAQRLEKSYGYGIKSEVVSSVLMSDMDRIADTIKLVDSDIFEAALDLLAGARRIFVVGLRQEAPIAGMLGFYLNLIKGSATVVSSSSMSEIFEQLLDADSRDVVVGISFPNYSLRTLKAMEYANLKNAGIISITDGAHSPMNIYSSVNLFARSDAASVVASLTAPLSLVNALVVGLCMRDIETVEKRIGALDEVWKEFQNYGPDELSL
jgi:DNA-binding MurR/RpiR family transcriptional regulator